MPSPELTEATLKARLIRTIHEQAITSDAGDAARKNLEHYSLLRSYDEAVARIVRGCRVIATTMPTQYDHEYRALCIRVSKHLNR